MATDILSRGIDIDEIELVINYDVPHDGEDYVHRIGRTARAETDGTAYTFVTEKEQGKMSRIEQLIGREVPLAQVPAELGAVPEYRPKERRPAGGEGGRSSGPGGKKDKPKQKQGQGRPVNEEKRKEARAPVKPAVPDANGEQPKRAPIKLEKRSQTPPEE